MSDAKIKSILIIKDRKNKNNNVADFLDKKLFSTYVITNIDEAKYWLESKKINLIIIQSDLSYRTSLKSILKIHKDHSDIAIILITDIKNEKIAFNAISKGIDDYLIEGEYTLHELLRSIRNTIERKKQFTKIERDLVKFTEFFSNTSFENTFRDISKTPDAFDVENYYSLSKANTIAHQNTDIFDSLTVLPNKTQFQAKIRDCLTNNIKGFAVFILDIDKFNSINDLYGHTIGDLLLISISAWLKKHLGHDEFLARIGGDEFGIIAHCSNISDYGHFAAKLNGISKCSFNIEGVKIRISLSIGIAINTCNESLTELIQNAEIALYNAKKYGRNSYQYFKKNVDEPKKRLLSIESQLHFAVTNNELWLLFQPIIELESRKVIGFEALLRWRSAVLGVIDPDIFIKIAEASSTISELTDWIIKKIIIYLVNWQKKYKSHFFISMNLSSVDIMQQNFTKKMLGNLKKFNVSPENLYVELTETAIMYDESVADKNLLALSHAGIKVLIDDFGTGYSSLNRIKSLPVDIIKIDKSFVRDIMLYEVDCQVIKSIISLANSLKLATIAEGIESEEVALYLQQLGCKYGQGFYFAKPMSIDEAMVFYEKNRNV